MAYQGMIQAAADGGLKVGSAPLLPCVAVPWPHVLQPWPALLCCAPQVVFPYSGQQHEVHVPPWPAWQRIDAQDEARSLQDEAQIVLLCLTGQSHDFGDVQALPRPCCKPQPLHQRQNSPSLTTAAGRAALELQRALDGLNTAGQPGVPWFRAPPCLDELRGTFAQLVEELQACVLGRRRGEWKGYQI